MQLIDQVFIRGCPEEFLLASFSNEQSLLFSFAAYSSIELEPGVPRSALGPSIVGTEQRDSRRIN